MSNRRGGALEAISDEQNQNRAIRCVRQFHNPE
jgi:hypothetical protein